MTKPLLVIGNGPSLKGFDFGSINCDSLGMNAAYRYWDQIGWYPTHYCCLDTELINTHHLEIRRLVETGKVKSAFLSGRMLELHPELASDKRYFFLDSVHPHWHHHRGKALGLPFIEHPAFKSSQPGKITTGGHSVRYGIYLGYDDIAIIGVDLKYVEIIPEAEKGEGLKLTIKETPKSNPNYFFDGYQQAGDTYQVPNPAQHNGLLHVQAFEALRDDAKANLPGVTIKNCNKESILFDQSVFPFEDLSSWMRSHRIAREIIILDSVERTYQAIAKLPWSPDVIRRARECARILSEMTVSMSGGTTLQNQRRHCRLRDDVSLLFLNEDDMHPDWDVGWG